MCVCVYVSTSASNTYHISYISVTFILHTIYRDTIYIYMYICIYIHVLAAYNSYYISYISIQFTCIRIQVMHIIYQYTHNIIYQHTIHNILLCFNTNSFPWHTHMYQYTSDACHMSVYTQYHISAYNSSYAYHISVIYQYKFFLWYTCSLKCSTGWQRFIGFVMM